MVYVENNAVVVHVFVTGFAVVDLLVVVVVIVAVVNAMLVV